ncbi:MAG TPA: NADH-quinone oxidoreductase subunit C [Nitrososphaeria archaeon]|nr:MAG: NADH-quinone oxidoreductase subunit C [Nitrososphaerota archaeon]HDJ66102.1 NADH-quinone oxidoreductase subunit C [Nitrososphaeria archaeon]
MSREEEILRKLEEKFGEKIKGIRIQRSRRIFAEVNVEDLKDVLRYAKDELGFDHISTITGEDLGEALGLIYHIAYENSIELSIKTRIPKNNPKIVTIIDLYPPAGIYEREVHDLLGVIFDGNPDLSPLLLPDNWPKDVYPLRKDVSLEEMRALIEKGGGEK